MFTVLLVAASVFPAQEEPLEVTATRVLQEGDAKIKSVEWNWQIFKASRQQSMDPLTKEQIAFVEVFIGKAKSAWYDAHTFYQIRNYADCLNTMAICAKFLKAAIDNGRALGVEL